MSTAAESSESPVKRQRVEAPNGKHDVTKGGQWVLDQTARMKRHYCVSLGTSAGPSLTPRKQALVSAALVLQYKTACKKA